MVTYFEMVREFHEAAKLPIADAPCWAVDSHYLRLNLHREEMAEIEDAFERKDMVALADGLADLIYVLCGTAVTFGIPLDAVFEEVHRSNMTKTIEPRWREDGKLIKGPHYEPPSLAPILAWRATESVTEGENDD